MTRTAALSSTAAALRSISSDLTILACEFELTIDRVIGAPGHGKDVVDGLNATDKIYLRKCM